MIRSLRLSHENLHAALENVLDVAVALNPNVLFLFEVVYAVVGNVHVQEQYINAC